MPSHSLFEASIFQRVTKTQPLSPVHFVPTLAGVFVASRNHALRREAFEARKAAAEIGPYTLSNRLDEGGMQAL